jgi:hypothetical protein
MLWCLYNKLIPVPDEGVALVLKDPDLLDGAEVSKGLLEELLTEAVGDAPAVHRAIGRRALVVHLVKAQRLRVHCRKRENRVTGKQLGHDKV